MCKDVGDAGLRQHADGVQQQRLIRATPPGLALRQCVVQVVQALDVRIEDVGGRAPHVHGDETDAGSQLVLGVDAHATGNAEQARPRAGGGIHTERTLTAGRDQPRVGLAVAVGAQRRQHDLARGLRAPGQRQADLPGGGGEAREVPVELEHAAVIHADALEDAVAVEEPVVGDRNARLADLDDAAVEPDHRVARRLAARAFGLVEHGETLGARSHHGLPLERTEPQCHQRDTGPVAPRLVALHQPAAAQRRQQAVRAGLGQAQGAPHRRDALRCRLPVQVEEHVDGLFDAGHMFHYTELYLYIRNQHYGAGPVRCQTRARRPP